MIKAILFDVGGVFIDLNRQRCLDNFHKLGFKEVDVMLDPCHQCGFFDELERGAISEDEFYRKVIDRANPGVTKEQVREAFLSFCNGVEEYKWDLVKDLSGKYDIYLLSNNNPIVLAEYSRMAAQKGVTVPEVIKKAFFSFRIKTVKPSEDFFRISLDGIGLPSDQLLFVDDSEMNLEIGRKFGMHTLLYKVGEDLSKLVYDELEKL